jgi:hypothetical protein
MRTTYRGSNRAQDIKKMREVLSYQQAKADGKVKLMREKFFAKEPSKLAKVWDSIKAIFSVLLAGLVAGAVFLFVLGYFMSAIK